MQLFFSPSDPRHSLIAVFPYLKTSHPVRIRGVEFRSSTDQDSLAADERDHLNQLFPMFYLQDGYRIAEPMTYAIRTVENPSHARTLSTCLSEAQTIISYIYTLPQPPTWEPFFHQEQADLYLFHPSRMWKGFAYPLGGVTPKPGPFDHSWVSGYECMLNLRTDFFVIAESKIFPRVPRQPLNISQDVHLDLGMQMAREELWPIRNLIAGQVATAAIEKRVFTALRWYNRSTSEGVDPDEELAHLAVALEALLGLPKGERVTERFRDAVVTLLGPVPRLSEWVGQFYDVRSNVLHDGEASDFYFYPDGRKSGTIGKGSPYHPLIVYARMVFHLCLKTLLAGAQMTAASNLSSLLTPNQERLETICTLLSESQKLAGPRLRDSAKHFADLSLCAIFPVDDVKPETIVAATRFLIQACIDEATLMSADQVTETQAFLQKLTSDGWKDLEIIAGLERIRTGFIDGTKQGGRRDNELPGLIDTFLDYVITELRHAQLWQGQRR